MKMLLACLKALGCHWGGLGTSWDLVSPLGLHLPEVAVRVEADPVAVDPKGSPDPWVPAVLQDAIGEQGFLSERDENGHVAQRVAEKQLRKDEPIERKPTESMLRKKTIMGQCLGESDPSLHHPSDSQPQGNQLL